MRLADQVTHLRLVRRDARAVHAIEDDDPYSSASAGKSASVATRNAGLLPGSADRSFRFDALQVHELVIRQELRVDDAHQVR